MIASLMYLPSEQQTHPALISALMLIATWFASPEQPLPEGTPPPNYFLLQTRLHLGNSLEDVDRLISYVGASCCLAWWYMQAGRMLEAQISIASTARLAISCGLHQISADVIRSVLEPATDSPARSYGLLGPPKTTKDLKDRIRSF